MSVSALLTLVNNELIAMGILPLGTPLRFGPSVRTPKVTPPQVYWIPKGGRGSAPLIAMSRSAQLAYTASGKSIPRSLATRMVGLECHLWAGSSAQSDDYSAVEDLLEAVNSAVHHTCQGAYEYHGDEYIAHGTEASNLGHKIIARFTIGTNLLELPAQTSPSVPVRDQQQSVTLLTATISVQEGPIQPGGTTTSVSTTIP